jgi:Aspartate/ornithine carbamoyltransferase, Asp/Orn binding domain
MQRAALRSEARSASSTCSRANPFGHSNDHLGRARGHGQGTGDCPWKEGASRIWARRAYRKVAVSHLLHIDSSIRVEGSVTRALSARAAEVWCAAHPGGTVTYHDLGARSMGDDARPKWTRIGPPDSFTEIWTRHGSEGDGERRRQALAGYQVNAGLMALARPEAVFLHCLPAHRGEEVTAEVIDGPQSVVWQQAANRLPTAQAALYALIAGEWEDA